MSRIILALLAFCASVPVIAGGSGERVNVTAFTRLSDTQFELVVRPEPLGNAAPDPYMGKCATFRVHGVFERLRGAWFNSNPIVTKAAHLKALDYLESAFREQRPVWLGWMGTGFVPSDLSKPCIVESRALVLLDAQGKTFVVSFHDAT